MSVQGICQDFVRLCVVPAFLCTQKLMGILSCFFIFGFDFWPNCWPFFDQVVDQILGQIFDQVFGQIFGYVFDQVFGQVLLARNTVYSSTRPAKNKKSITNL